MNELYKCWYERPDVQQQFLRFVPSLKHQKTVRELGIFFPIEGEDRPGVVRSGIFYSMNNFWRISSKVNKCSILTTLETFYYHDDKTDQTLPFTDYKTISKDPEWYKAHRRTCDFLIDIDNLTFSTEDRKRLLLLYEHLESQFPAQSVKMKFSGKKGLHFFVPAKFLKTFDLGEFNLLASGLADFFPSSLSKLDEPYIDLSAYSPKKIFRLPLSIHERSDCVSYPLEAHELDTFEPKDLSIEKVIQLPTLPSWRW